MEGKRQKLCCLPYHQLLISSSFGLHGTDGGEFFVFLHFLEFLVILSASVSTGRADSN
jgi:hypothetical protein